MIMIRTVFACLATMLLFGGCVKEELPTNYGTIIFYKQSTAASFSVFINNIPYGEVPYAEREPPCNTGEGLRLRMEPGTYWLDIRNHNSTIYKPPVQITISRGECKLYRVQP